MDLSHECLSRESDQTVFRIPHGLEARATESTHSLCKDALGRRPPTSTHVFIPSARSFPTR